MDEKRERFTGIAEQYGLKHCLFVGLKGQDQIDIKKITSIDGLSGEMKHDEKNKLYLFPTVKKLDHGACKDVCQELGYFFFVL